MKFYLIDDDQNILNILKLIIKNRNLGEICGTSLNPADALEDLKYIQPDIIIVDLLMPIMDGIHFVKKASPLYPDAAFIMLSQVAAKDMISSAYESGIEFFIQKPINSIEVENVIRNVSQKVTMQRAIGEMQNLFMNQMQQLAPQKEQRDESQSSHIDKTQDILQKLGIIGEIGSKDIISIVDYMITHRDTVADATLTELCSHFSDNPKSMEQRIRRTANSAMVNLANLGIEDLSLIHIYHTSESYCVQGLQSYHILQSYAPSRQPVLPL